MTSSANSVSRTTTWQGLGQRFWSLWTGDVDARALRFFAIGLGLVILLRTSEWTPGQWVSMQGHFWFDSSGRLALEDWPSRDPALAPELHSPLLPGLPRPSDALLGTAVVVRTLLAVALVVGVGSRWTPAALFLVAYLVMALDRYRYAHHLHLLWWSCLLLAFAPLGQATRRLQWRKKRSTTEHVERQANSAAKVHVAAQAGRLAKVHVEGRAERPANSRVLVPRWPLQLLRLQALVVYFAAAAAKCNPTWLSGTLLELQTRVGLFSGEPWAQLVRLLGYSGLAWAVLVWEASLVVLLAIPTTRRLGIVFGIALHAAIAMSTVVSSFGLQMLLYLGLFWNWEDTSRSDVMC